MRASDDDKTIGDEGSSKFIKLGHKSSTDTFETVKMYNVEDMIREAGGFGPWHYFTFITCILVGCLSTMFIYTMPILELMPSLLCKNSDGIMYSCQIDQVCTNGEVRQGVQFELDYEQSETIYNWIAQMDLYCISKFEIGLFGSIYFIGFVISGFLLMLADRYGRRTMTFYGVILASISAYLLFLCKNLNLGYLLVF